MDIKFKTLKVADKSKINQIIKIYKDAGWWYNYDNPKRLKEIINGSYIFFVGESKGKIIAIARIISDGINDAYIQDFSVLKEFRNKGIGSKMLKFIIKTLKKKGFKWMGLISEKKSVSLYCRAGFKESYNKVPMIYEVKKTK
jgi:ribosomal protein S18 acetylase RimI-like enzyme